MRFEWQCEKCSLGASLPGCCWCRTVAFTEVGVAVAVVDNDLEENEKKRRVGLNPLTGGCAV